MKKRFVILTLAISISTLILSFGCYTTSTPNQPTPQHKPSGNTWDSSASFSLYTNNNNFYKVEAVGTYNDAGNPCKLITTVRFYATYSLYYRYQAKVTFRSGAWIKSPIFYNSSSGYRYFSFFYDTAHQGCWAKNQQVPQYLKVGSCIGASCTVPFVD